MGSIAFEGGGYQRALSRARTGSQAGFAAADINLRSAAQPVIDDQTPFALPKLDHAIQRAGLDAQLAAELL